MDLSPDERAVMERFWEKARLAGDPKPGYNLRKESVCYHHGRGPGADLESGLEALVERGLLKSNEAGDRFVLTEEGAEHLTRTFRA